MTILYVMNVEWNWIKQRPHFLAEKLSKYYGFDNVLIIAPRSWSKRRLQHRTIEGFNVKEVYHIPLIGRFKVGRIINKYYESKQIKRMLKTFHPNLMYLCAYYMACYVPKAYKGMVLYDCMDDIPSFPSLKKRKKEIIENERNIYNLSNIILASSESIKYKLIERYGKKDITIVRNGFPGDIINTTGEPTLDNNSARTIDKRSNYKFCYFGTISNWFDWNVILRSLEDFENIEYLLMGPVEAGTSIPKNPKIKYLGTIEHDKLFEMTKDVDCFLMPFLVNDLILSVDPVKIYEYINFNKNILMVKYPEVIRFNPFVYFYITYDDYKNAIITLLNNSNLKYSQQLRLDFLKDNGWDSRAKQIIKIIENN